MTISRIKFKYTERLSDSSVLYQGNTALMLALKQRDLELAGALLGAKANVEATHVTCYASMLVS